LRNTIDKNDKPDDDAIPKKAPPCGVISFLRFCSVSNDYFVSKSE
jgi:hypothetical protein